MQGLVRLLTGDPTPEPPVVSAATSVNSASKDGKEVKDASHCKSTASPSAGNAWSGEKKLSPGNDDAKAKGASGTSASVSSATPGQGAQGAASGTAVTGGVPASTVTPIPPINVISLLSKTRSQFARLDERVVLALINEQALQERQYARSGGRSPRPMTFVQEYFALHHTAADLFPRVAVRLIRFQKQQEENARVLSSGGVLVLE